MIGCHKCHHGDFWSPPFYCEDCERKLEELAEVEAEEALLAERDEAFEALVAA